MNDPSGFHKITSPGDGRPVRPRFRGDAGLGGPAPGSRSCMVHTYSAEETLTNKLPGCPDRPDRPDRPDLS
jgi:hypothetical protein